MSYNINNLITAKDIASRFESIHLSEISNKTYEYMENQNYDIYGIHNDDRNIIGYISLDGYKVGHYKVSEIALNDIVSSNTCLGTIFSILRNKKYIFVLNKDKVNNIITVADLTKYAAKAYVFLLATSFESIITDIIRMEFKEIDIRQRLTNKVLEDVLEIYNTRKNNKIDIDLFDCINLNTKNKLFSEVYLIEDIGFSSKTKFNNFFSTFIHKIRNPISHSNDYIGEDNKNEVIDCIVHLERIINILSENI